MLKSIRMRLTPFQLSLIYVVASGFWVISSSELVFFELKTQEEITRWEIIKGTGFILASGTLIYWITRRLVSRLLKSQESLHAMKDHAQQLQNQLIQVQKLETLGRLSSSITHDFNNVLNAIAGNAHLLQKDITTGSGKSRLDAINSATQRATTLTRQLLTFSRSQVLDLKPVNLNNVVRQTDGVLARLLGPEINLKLDLEWGLGETIADEDQLSQVLMNLCFNARDAMPHGGTLEIETRSVQVGADLVQRLAEASPGPSVLLTVRDYGTGISPAIRAKMFEPFVTSKEPGKGTGLGLSIVRGIVKQSGGFIDVSSELGKGAAFHVYFPRTSTAAADSSQANPRPEPMGATDLA